MRGTGRSEGNLRALMASKGNRGRKRGNAIKRVQSMCVFIKRETKCTSCRLKLCLTYRLTKQGTHQTTHKRGDKLGLVCTSPSSSPTWYHSPKWPRHYSPPPRVHQLHREHEPTRPGPRKKQVRRPRQRGRTSACHAQNPDSSGQKKKHSVANRAKVACG